MLDYQPGELGRLLRFKDRTLQRVLQIQVGLGDKPLVRANDRVLSYGSAPKIAASYAAKLIDTGVKPGDRIITFVSSRIELIELWLGAAWAGAILVPLNIAYRGEQLRHSIETARPTLIFTEQDLIEPLRAVPDAVAAVKRVFVFTEQEQINLPSMGAVKVEKFVHDGRQIEPYQAHPGDDAAILYTSGTTGPSKGVLCPHAQFYWYAVHTAESLNIKQNDVLFTVLPFFHINALNSLWQAMLYGATYSFADRFSASRFWEQASGNGATITYLLGAMAQILLKRPASELDQTNTIRAALCPATPEETVFEFQDRFGVKLSEGYGSTETSLVFSNLIGGHAPGSMGRLVDGFEARIVDENDCDVEDGQPGELLIRHREPFSMSNGYFGNPTATLKSWKNLWFHTGDRVLRNPETGIYSFLDRLVDAIRRRGENISSWEVENALMSYPDIEVAAVVGVPSDLGSEEDVMAFIVARRGCAVEPASVIEFLKSRLAYFAIPRYWEMLDAMPVTPNGKIKKHTLRERGFSMTTWDREKHNVLSEKGAPGTN